MNSDLKARLEKKNAIVCVLGMGYVGLPLALDFDKHLKVIGYDIAQDKLDTLAEEYKDTNIEFTSDPTKIKEADFVLICVPTPVTKAKDPDLSYVESSARTVGKNIKQGAIIVLESTVFPGVTEDTMARIIEEESGLKCGEGFKVGYSPERINPGDDAHSLDKITKVVAGMDDDSSQLLNELYGLVTTVYLAQNIKTAEAAKVIENVQRDLNIALMNELTMIFHKMGINGHAVFDAAATKWNFHRYKPGMVGGHCIPVDPYYLVHKAVQLDYHPQVILAGRAINDHMPKYVAELTIKSLNESGKVLKGSKVLIMGLTYKENVPDTRSSPVMSLVKELKEFGIETFGYDPLLSKKEIEGFGVRALEELHTKMDAVVVTVAHDEFKKMTLEDIWKFLSDKPVLIDVREIFNGDEARNKGFYYKTL